LIDYYARQKYIKRSNKAIKEDSLPSDFRDILLTQRESKTKQKEERVNILSIPKEAK
jgi:hypothetical protein